MNIICNMDFVEIEKESVIFDVLTSLALRFRAVELALLVRGATAEAIVQYS